MSKYVDVEPIIQYAQEQVTAVFAYPQNARKEDERAERKVWRGVLDYLVNAQEVDVTIVKHGRWVIYPVPPWDGEDVKCSVCGQTGCAPYWNYCPNCGVRMDLEDEVEE